MSDTLRIKRRPSAGAAGAPATLAAAEIAFNENDNTLYYGKGDTGGGVATSVVPIAGSGAFVSKHGDIMDGNLNWFFSLSGGISVDCGSQTTTGQIRFYDDQYNIVGRINGAWATKVMSFYGGTGWSYQFTKPLLVAADPVAPLEVATKQYVDGKAGSGGSSCTISDTPPASPKAGDFWFESDSGMLFVRVDDGTSQQWVVSTSTQGPLGPIGPQGPPGVCTVSDTPPPSPSSGQFWFESDTGIMWIWIVDANSSQWVQYSGGGIYAIQEAPVDGRQYARQSAGWSPVAGTVSISDTPPASPLDGQQWFRSDIGVMYLRYPDIDGSQWIASSQPGPAGPAGPPGQWTQITQAAYNALSPPNPNTLYVIIG